MTVAVPPPETEPGLSRAVSNVSGVTTLSTTVREILHLPWWRRLLRVQGQQARQIVTEMLVVKEIFPLLMKVRNGGKWTPEEKRELLAHLRRLARLSPYLLLLLLPGSAVLLPLYAWWLDRRRGKRSGSAVPATPSPARTPAPPEESLPPDTLLLEQPAPAGVTGR